MRAALIALSVAALVTAGCGDDAAEQVARQAEKVADALTRAVKFENGVSRSGSIAKLDPAAATVSLDSSTAALDLAPGATAMILPLDVTTDPGDAVEATLLQFDGASSHTEVPVGDNASAGDGGGAGGGDALHIENAFDVADDVCDRLCNRVHTARLSFAVQLEGGAVSAQVSIAIRLDCRDDGDPELCEGSGGGGGQGGGDDGGDVSRPDGGSALGGSGGSGGRGGQGGGDDAGAGLDSGLPPADAGMGSGDMPQVTGILPETATAGEAFMLTISGTGFSQDAVVYVDGVAVPTTVTSEGTIEADIPASATADAGSHVIYVANVPGDPTSRSTVLYLQVAPAPGAPVVYDYSPDNGVAGDTILIIASNLMGQTLTIEDAAGTTLEPGTLGTISWPNVGSADTVEVVLPDGVVTGPITVANMLGAYKGKIFSVGQNLTRAAGTVVTSSTEYNTSNWSRASGADNDLATSFFTAVGDCASLDTCTTVPWFMVTFADPQTVARIAMRGNREYASGYDFIRGSFEVLNADATVLWEGAYELPSPDRDIDIVLPVPVRGASSVRFTSLEDESSEPGFSELEVFAR